MSEDLLNYVVDYALSLGAKYAEARYQADETLVMISRNGKLITLGKNLSDGIGIRLIYNGVLTFSATNKLDRSNLIDVVRKTVDRAKAISYLLKNPVRFSDDRVERGSYEVNVLKDFNSLDISEKVKLLEELHKSVTKTTKEVKVPTTYAEYVEHVQKKLIFNSEGGLVKGMVPRISIMFNLVLHHNSKGTLQRLMQWGASGGLELIDYWNPTKTLEDEVMNLEKVLLYGIEPPKEPVDVIVGSEIVGLVVHESAGHPMEADRILGREAAQAGESYVKPEYFGRFRIGNEYATVIEDPTISGSFGFYGYDDECIKARPRYLYKEGIVNEPLHNRSTASTLNTKSNGSSRSMDYASEPIVRMSNTYLKPGDTSFEELVEDVNYGVYIKSYMEWNIDDIRWNQRYVGLESYIIINGEIKDRVRNPVLEISTASFYNNIAGVDRELRFYPGTCGKGEPPQGIPVWFGGPNVKLSKIKLGVQSYE
ncbi:MAG: TldD/PmbA family protein [Sulfolobales archaeon]